MSPFLSLLRAVKPNRQSTRRNRRLKTRRLRMMESLEDRRLLATLNFTAAGQVIQRQRVHGGRSRRARRDLNDRRAEFDLFRVCADPPMR